MPPELNIPMVYPSGLAFTISRWPIAPPAPGLLSTTTGTLICLPSASARSRMLMSLPPPAGQATIRVIGSEGKLSACKGGAAASVPAVARAMAANVAKILHFMSRLPRDRRRSSDLSAAAVSDQQKLCHKLLHDIERKQTVLNAAKQPQNRLIDSRIDEVVQTLGAMLRCSRDTESFNRFVGDEGRGTDDVATGDRGNHGLLIDRNT